MPGFPTRDHARVSAATIWVERNRDNLEATVETGRKDRGLVRVMLLEQLFVDDALPDLHKGDFLMDGVSLKAAITQPTSVDFGGKVHYVVRCVASDQSVTPRTWQLRVVPPERGAGFLTSPIDEHATGEEVAAAINATGCPECFVFGSDVYLLAQDGTQVSWPSRQWHIVWPDDDWYLSTQRQVDIGGSTPGLEYDVGGDEVPIALIPTRYAPTPYCEDVTLPYTMSFAAPTAGTFALCQVLPGLGLVLVDKECWTYVD